MLLSRNFLCLFKLLSRKVHKNLYKFLIQTPLEKLMHLTVLKMLVKSENSLHVLRLTRDTKVFKHMSKKLKSWPLEGILFPTLEHYLK